MCVRICRRKRIERRLIFIIQRVAIIKGECEECVESLRAAVDTKWTHGLASRTFIVNSPFSSSSFQIGALCRFNHEEDLLVVVVVERRNCK